MLILAFFVYLNYFQPLGIFLFRSFYALICQIIPGQFLSGKIFFLPDVLCPQNGGRSEESGEADGIG